MPYKFNPFTNNFDSVNGWGSITGNLSDQTDLQNALDLKANAADYVPYTGATTDIDLNTRSLTTEGAIYADNFYGAGTGSGVGAEVWFGVNPSKIGGDVVIAANDGDGGSNPPGNITIRSGVGGDVRVGDGNKGIIFDIDNLSVSRNLIMPDSDVDLSVVLNTSGVNTGDQTIASLGLDDDLATFSLPSNTTISSFGATLIDDSDAATARTTLGLVAGGAGDIWVEKAGDSMSGALTLGLNSAALNLGDNTNATVYSNIQGTRSYVGYDANGYAVLQGGASKGLRLNVNNATFGVGTAVEIDTAGQFKMAGATSSSTGILLGGDVNLYRSSSNLLKTDDSLEVVGTTYSQGNMTIGTGSTSVDSMYVQAHTMA